MKKDYILVIDSGVGGLSILSKAYKILPSNYIYFADNKNAPYGIHSKEKIYIFVKDIIINLLKKYDIKIVVLACNTATTAAIEKLRKTFANIHFIGTEPAINLAYKKHFKSAVVIATPTTIKQQKYKNLTAKTPIQIFSLKLKTFATAIEKFFTHKHLWDGFVIQKNIYNICYYCRNSDCIILGCTHYGFVKEKIENISQKPIIDGTDGVLKQICYFKDKLTNFNNEKSSLKFIVSDSSLASKEIYKKIFNEILAKV